MLPAPATSSRPGRADTLSNAVLCCAVQDVSEEGFPVRCLPIGASPLASAATAPGAASEDSDAAETSRGAFSVLSRADPQQPLKRRLSDAMLLAQAPDGPNKCLPLGLVHHVLAPAALHACRAVLHDWKGCFDMLTHSAHAIQMPHGHHGNA